MQINLTAEQEARLSQLAAQEGKGAEELAGELFTRYLAEEGRFVAAVELGEAALQRGEYLTHEQVGERLDRLFNS
jgi:predicted transcriptional regulator